MKIIPTNFLCFYQKLSGGSIIVKFIQVWTIYSWSLLLNFKSRIVLISFHFSNPVMLQIYKIVLTKYCFSGLLSKSWGDWTSNILICTFITWSTICTQSDGKTLPETRHCCCLFHLYLVVARAICSHIWSNIIFNLRPKILCWVRYNSAQQCWAELKPASRRKFWEAKFD